MKTVQYFISGTCYIKGRNLVARRFNGIITEEYTRHPDPSAALESRKKAEAGKVAGLNPGDFNPDDIYVHVEQFNVLIAR